MDKQVAIISPRQKQARNLTRGRSLAEINEMLAWDEVRVRRAQVDALLKHTPAPRPATNRTQGSRQAYYGRTRCEACWSGALLMHENAVECLACSHVGERWYSFDTNRYPGAQSCKHCGSISVVYRAKTLHCRICGEDSLRWP
jgi:hypothetical protein